MLKREGTMLKREDPTMLKREIKSGESPTMLKREKIFSTYLFSIHYKTKKRAA